MLIILFLFLLFIILVINYNVQFYSFTLHNKYFNIIFDYKLSFLTYCNLFSEKNREKTKASCDRPVDHP